ncbi:MAG: hypothetical protein H7177_09160 [Rhizobacter sp.]|nr:hypothetical protein [Bacteriovorax sp.]
MKHILFLSLLLLPVLSFAENKLSVELTIDDLHFLKPVKGVGKAGSLIFKSANVNNSGIILNINNVNNYFDSQIFIRPTFLGFTTQFGNYGFALDDQSLFNAINVLELKNSKLLLDDNQLNLSGETLKFVNADTDLKMDNFRLYCQSPSNGVADAPPTDLMKNCTNYLTLNGTYKSATDFASLELRSSNQLTGDKTVIKTKLKSIDIRSDKILLSLNTAQSISNDSYFITASDLNVDCAKDPKLTELNFDKIQKDCLNRIKVTPLKANINDKKEKSNFNLDIKDITIKDKILYFTLNSGALSDATSTTYINDLLLNCKKETDTDVLELTQVLNDCLSYARISIAEVKSTKPDDANGSSIKKIAVSSAMGVMIIQADVKILGFNSRVSIYGNGKLDQAKRQLTINVTDTKLPFGFTSVKLLMYFLKKNLISKDITYSNNNITISL